MLLTVADTNKLFYLGKRSGLILAELYAKQHDYKQSLESYKRYTAFSNSDNKQKMQQNAQIYDARYRLSLNRQKIELLRDFPLLGRERHDLYLGSRSFPIGKYIIIYQPTDKILEIVRVRHGSTKLDDLFEI
ncbi:MAG: type II toxin-antitoxin system RelE/ParE family toxin [Blastocatellia bacterium]|nr:type II toxin-antitoxin system RelE/ParE family toxin [Blastocatellia bacterium]